MTTIFNFINDILCYKKGDLLDNVADESNYNSYMVNRWLSMYSPNVADLVNYTTNRYYSVFDTKQSHYKFLTRVVPHSKIYRINYIKKTSKHNSEDTQTIAKLANHLELSQREIRYYIESDNIDISKYKKLWEH